MHYFSAFILMCLLSAVSFSVKAAEDSMGQKMGQNWVVVSGLSHHTAPRGGSKPYREFNYGQGVRRDLAESNWSIEGNWYRNSLDRGSVQLAASYYPFSKNTEGLGLRMGVVSGYQKNLAPYIFPVYAIKTDVKSIKLGVDFLIAPGFLVNRVTVFAVGARIGF